MRLLVRVLVHPALVMMALGAVYVALQIPPGDRLQFFTIIAMTAVGTTELAAAGVGYALKKQTSGHAIAQLVTATGALLLAFAALGNISIVPWVIGAVIFALGGLLTLRTVVTAA